MNHSQPKTLEEADAYLSSLITETAQTQGRTAPTSAEIRQAFDSLGDFYTRQAPSEERDNRALELARTLIFNFDDFTGALVTASAADSPDYQTALAMLQAGKPATEILAALGPVCP